MTGALALLALAVGFTAGMIWLAYLVATAPEGWEDSDGFHTGPMPPELPDAGRDGVDFKTAYQAIDGHSDSDRLALFNLSLHATGDTHD
jgi:hypothetical protein